MGTVNRMLQNLRNMSFLKEASWLEEFENKLEKTLYSHKWTALVHYLIMLWILSPVKEENNPIDNLDDDPFYHNEKAKRLYNRIVWKIIQDNPPTRQKIRQVLLKDLKTTDKSPGMEEYGRIARHDYSRNLLDHFLKDETSWT